MAIAVPVTVLATDASQPTFEAGCTEVTVDNHGIVYVAEFVRLISKEAQCRNVKSVRRNNLRDIDHKARADCIEEHNLGTGKQAYLLAKVQAGIEGDFYQALNPF